MCGIIGYLSRSEVSQEIIKNMISDLSHRGPDDSSVFVDRQFTAGHCRLSINDIKGGGQPLYSDDGNIVLTYNGEIYNYYKLKDDLEKAGYTFKTTCDGEVICHLFDKYGENCFNKLDGMFAISLWCKNTEKLYLVRDRIGEKPLYYSFLENGEGIVYSSEIRAFKNFSNLTLSLNKQVIWDFLSFLWVPEPLTIYNEVYSLMPGEMLVFSEYKAKIKKYSQHKKREAGLEYKTLTKRTRKAVINSIESRLISDVEVGAFLSGGIDSSIITAITSQRIPNLKTYTIAFEKGMDPYAGYSDESDHAESFSEKYKTDHTTIRVTSKDFKDILKDFVHYSDQPFGVSSGLGVFCIARKAREDGIKVLLSGDGADEMFGGYMWYKYLKEVEKSSGELSEELMEDFSFLNSSFQIEDKLKKLKTYSSDKRAWGWHYYASEKSKKIIFSNELSDSCKSSHRHFSEFNDQDIWECEEYIRNDRAFYLPNEMLKKADRMGMANSVEIRVPFVSREILELVDNIKHENLIFDGNLKSLLKDGFKDELGQEVLDRPKHGFNVPIDKWLKNEWKDLVEETFSSESELRKHSIINENFSLKEATAMIYDKKQLHGHTIFCLIVLNMWLEREYASG